MITLMNARIQIFLSTDHAMEMNGQKYTPASHRGADPHEALSIGDASVLADNLPVGTRPIFAVSAVPCTSRSQTSPVVIFSSP